MFLIIWALLGLTNGNFSAITDTKSFVEMLLIVIISCSCINNVSEVRRLFGYFAFALLLLCVIHSLLIFLGRIGYNLGLSLGRYSAVLIFGYCYYLGRILGLRERNKWDVLYLTVFTIGILIDFDKPLIFTMLCSTVGMVFVLILKGKLKKSRIMASFILVSILLVIAFQGFTVFGRDEAIQSYKKQIMLRYLKTEGMEYNNISDAFYNQVYLGKGDLSSGRIDLWLEGWDIFKENVLIGKGLGYYINSFIGEMMIHNIYLYFLVCTGICGSVLVLWVTLQCCLILFRGLKADEDLDLKNGLLGFIFGAFCFNLVDIFLTFYGLMVMFSICLGVLLKLSLMDIEKRKIQLA